MPLVKIEIIKGQSQEYKIIPKGMYAVVKFP
jgi:hypothetical protein